MARHTKAYLALAFVCIVWGTTYLALRIAVQHYPAFLFAAIRQVVSGVLIMAMGFLMSRKVDFSKSNLLHQAMVGFLLITIGNGLVSWGERYIPSGVAALLCSLMPLFAVLTNLVISRQERITPLIALGMAMGIGGVGLIFKDNISDLANSSYLTGILCILTATVSWSIGSVLNKKKTNQINPVFNSGVQLLCGGIFLFAGSPIVDDYSGEMNLMQPDVLWSMLYLIVFGSVLAYTAYMFALKELPVGIVTLYAYINPLVAVILGYFLLDEQLTVYTALAFLTIVAGVYTVNSGYRKMRKV